MRRGWIIGLVIAVVVVAVGAAWALWPDHGTHSATFSGQGVVPVRVEAPAAAGSIGIHASDAPAAGTVPSGMRVLSRPVRIDADRFDGWATITFDYGGRALPAGADQGQDLTLLTRRTDLGAWLPTGGVVDTAKHTVTVKTKHFSEWTLAVTDPVALAAAQDDALRSRSTAGGQLGRILAGDDEELDCSPRNLLLPARGDDPLTLSTKLCEEVVADGSYRLTWVNTGGVPRLLKAPPGFTVEPEPEFTTDRFIAWVRTRGDSRTAVVGPGGKVTFRFAGGAVATGTEITGDVDWVIYSLGIIRSVVSLVVGSESEGGAHYRGKTVTKLARKIDDLLSDADSLDCVGKNAPKAGFRGSGAELAAALGDTVRTCLPTILKALVKGLGSLLGVAGLALTSIFKRRLNVLAAVPEALKLARDEISGLSLSLLSLGRNVDTRLHLEPTRVMTTPEAAALAVTPHEYPYRDYTSLTPGAPLPAGAPAGLTCVQVVSADLDGNGKPDRLLTWDTDDPAAASSSERRISAVAYLDDGTFHLLDDSPRSWTATDEAGATALRPVAVARLGNDRREQVVAAFDLSGANTIHNVVLTVTADKHLRTVVGEDAGFFEIATGGGAAYSSEFGCATADGKRLATLASTVTHFQTGTYSLSASYYRLEGRTLTWVGQQGGFRATQAAAQQRLAKFYGQECRSAPTVSLAKVAATPEAALTTVLGARNEDAAAPYLSGGDESWRNGAGMDVWGLMTGSLRSGVPGWRSATPSCVPPTTNPGGIASTTCTVAGPAGPLTALLQQYGPRYGWTVDGIGTG
jgi:hypothetical protein